MTDTDILIGLLQSKTKLVAMLAPSFPVMYDYPDIISRLRALGFFRVVEVAVGAVKTNQAVVALVKANPQARYITSPCPSFVRLVRRKYPQLVQYLAFQADSPMIATARIVQEKYPECKPVFIGPCNVKKLEAQEDYPDLHVLVLTYKEMEDVFKAFPQCSSAAGSSAFDLTESSTRGYPLDGGLTGSSGLRDLLPESAIRIVSGWKNCDTALQEFEQNKEIRFLDILFCEGGCMNGPGIVSSLSLEDRKKKIQDFITQTG